MRILAMFAKDLKSGFRNLEILFVVLVPVLLSMGYNIASSTLSSSRPKVVVCCPDESLKTTLSGIEEFKETRFTTDWNEAVSMVEAGKVHGAFLVPERFGSPEESEEKPVVVVVLDSASPIRASVVRRILKDFIDDHFNVDSPVDLRIEELGKSTKKQRMLDFWLLFSIVMIGVAVIPLSLGEEKDRKTLDAVLLSPASEWEIVLAKGAWGFFLITINVVLLLVLNDGFAGNNALLIPVLFLGIISMVSIGLLVAILSPTQSIATQAGALAMIVIFVSVQVAAFNDSIREVIWILPWHQVLEGIRRAIFSEWGVARAWLNLLVLSAWAGILFFVNILALKKREP